MSKKNKKNLNDVPIEDQDILWDIKYYFAFMDIKDVSKIRRENSYLYFSIKCNGETKKFFLDNPNDWYECNRNVPNDWKNGICGFKENYPNEYKEIDDFNNFMRDNLPDISSTLDENVSELSYVDSYVKTSLKVGFFNVTFNGITKSYYYKEFKNLDVDEVRHIIWKDIVNIYTSHLKSYLKCIDVSNLNISTIPFSKIEQDFMEKVASAFSKESFRIKKHRAYLVINNSRVKTSLDFLTLRNTTYYEVILDKKEVDGIDIEYPIDMKLKDKSVENVVNKIINGKLKLEYKDIDFTFIDNEINKYMDKMKVFDMENSYNVLGTSKQFARTYSYYYNPNTKKFYLQMHSNYFDVDMVGSRFKFDISDNHIGFINENKTFSKNILAFINKTLEAKEISIRNNNALLFSHNELVTFGYKDVGLEEYWNFPFISTKDNGLTATYLNKNGVEFKDGQKEFLEAFKKEFKAFVKKLSKAFEEKEKVYLEELRARNFLMIGSPLARDILSFVDKNEQYITQAAMYKNFKGMKQTFGGSIQDIPNSGRYTFLKEEDFDKVVNFLLSKRYLYESKYKGTYGSFYLLKMGYSYKELLPLQTPINEIRNMIKKDKALTCDELAILLNQEDKTLQDYTFLISHLTNREFLSLYWDEIEKMITSLKGGEFQMVITLLEMKIKNGDFNEDKKIKSALFKLIK